MTDARDVFETVWSRRRILAIPVGLILLLSIHLSGSRTREQRKPSESDHLCVYSIATEQRLELRPVLANGKPGESESFTDMVGRLKPRYAINGTYYDESYRPLGDILIDGKLVVRGHYPNAIAVRNDGRMVFVRRAGKQFDWTGYRHALAAGPMLVRRGQVHLDPNADGFRLKALKIKAPRSGVGLRNDGTLLFVVRTDSITLKEFAETMLRAGARDAMNLDGGPACGLCYRGKVRVNAALPMTNILTVTRRTSLSRH